MPNKTSAKLKNFKKALNAHNIKWEKVQSGTIWKPEKEGESIVGEIMAHSTIDTKFGIAPQVEIGDGMNAYLLLSSKAALKILNRIPLNTPVRVTYAGTVKVKGRKTLMDNFTIEMPEGTKLEEDWTGGKYYRKADKPKGKSRR